MRDLHAEFVRCGLEAKKWMRKCEMLLPEINRLGIFREKGFLSIYEYAAKLAGMNHEKVNDCLRIMKHIEDKPELLEVARRKGLGALRPVATIATKKDARFWAKKVMAMKKHTLETYVREYKVEKVRPGTDFRLEKVEMELDPKVANQLRKMKGGKDWNTFMKELMEGRAKPESVKTESKHIPIAIKKYVATKTSGICAHPNCNKPAEAFHHTNRFSLTHEHDPDKIVPLCKAHHQIAHFGLIENEDKQPYVWRLREDPDPTERKYQIDRRVQAYMTG